MKLRKKILKISMITVSAVLMFILLSNLWIFLSTKDRVFSNPDDLPEYEVALVLGTSRFTIEGGENPYFTYRIQLAADLYKKGKVKYIIVSGDNNTKYYNEPKEMRDALLLYGIPYRRIILDYAGFRTLDSMIRCKEIFGQQKVVVITQRFHTFRAIFIGDFYGMEASAIAARNLPFRKSFMMELREALARSKAVIDLYILRESPKFLGEKEIIGAVQ